MPRSSKTATLSAAAIDTLLDIAATAAQVACYLVGLSGTSVDEANALTESS